MKLIKHFFLEVENPTWKLIQILESQKLNFSFFFFLALKGLTRGFKYQGLNRGLICEISPTMFPIKFLAKYFSKCHYFKQSDLYDVAKRFVKKSTENKVFEKWSISINIPLRYFWKEHPPYVLMKRKNLRSVFFMSYSNVSNYLFFDTLWQPGNKNNWLLFSQGGSNIVETSNLCFTNPVTCRILYITNKCIFSET